MPTLTPGHLLITVVLYSQGTAEAQILGPNVPEMQELRCSSSSEALVRSMNDNRINDNNNAMNGYIIPPPATIGSPASPPSQRASTAASGLEQNFQTSIETFPEYESLRKTSPVGQDWI